MILMTRTVVDNEPYITVEYVHSDIEERIARKTTEDLMIIRRKEIASKHIRSLANCELMKRKYNRIRRSV